MAMLDKRDRCPASGVGNLRDDRQVAGYKSSQPTGDGRGLWLLRAGGGGGGLLEDAARYCESTEEREEADESIETMLWA